MKLFLTMLLISVIISSCNMMTGSGRRVTEKRSVHDFTEIESAGSIEIEISHGDKLEVEVEADDNILSRVLTRVKNGRMSVMFEEGSYKNVHAKVFVTIPSVDMLLVSGSGAIISRDTISNNENILLEINGSGSIQAMVNSPSVKAEVEGSGSISVSGRTKTFTVKNSGSGSINASGLLSESAIVKNSGSGTSNVFASVMLDVDLDGSGDVTYGGNPPSTKLEDDGSGDIKKRN